MMLGLSLELSRSQKQREHHQGQHKTWFDPVRGTWDKGHQPHFSRGEQLLLQSWFLDQNPELAWINKEQMQAGPAHFSLSLGLPHYRAEIDPFTLILED